jgi:hypothetical protein
MTASILEEQFDHKHIYLFVWPYTTLMDSALQFSCDDLTSKILFSSSSSEMNRMHMESTIRTELDMLKKEKVSKEDQIRKT